MSKQAIFDKFIELMGRFAEIKEVAALREHLGTDLFLRRRSRLPVQFSFFWQIFRYPDTMIL